jgi:hypothetical protein
MKMKIFETHDLYLASALKIFGFRLINLKVNEKGRGAFVFEDRDDRSQIVRDFFSGELVGSLKAFSNAWADLKGFISETEKER